MSKSKTWETDSFNIIIEPAKVVTKQEFLSDFYTGKAIALDGWCHGAPFMDLQWRKFNFNHHEDVLRLAARATCGQVQMAINLGLMDNFRTYNKISGHVWINDVDQDTALAIWLLLNPGLATNTRVNALVNVEEHLDTTAGAYPYYPDFNVMQSIFWIFEPYDEMRIAGKLGKLSASEMQTLLEAICSRITAHVCGTGQTLLADTRFEILKTGSGWAMIKETGRQARYGVFNHGINCYVIFLGNEVISKDKVIYRYTIGKKSNLVAPNFDLPTIFEKLNKLEKIKPKSTDRWGGSDSIGGSPRKSGSKLSPDQLFEAIENFLR